MCKLPTCKRSLLERRERRARFQWCTCQEKFGALCWWQGSLRSLVARARWWQGLCWWQGGSEQQRLPHRACELQPHGRELWHPSHRMSSCETAQS